VVYIETGSMERELGQRQYVLKDSMIYLGFNWHEHGTALQMLI